MLWQAWEREHNPPPLPPVAAPPGDAHRCRARSDAHPRAGVPAPRRRHPARRRRPQRRAAGQTIEIRTDLYVADIDTVGGTIARVALDKHRDAQDPAKPYLALQRNAERTFVAQAGLIGEGFPNHRTSYEPLPGPRDARAGRRPLQVKLQATAANGDKVVQTLTFHRGSYVIDVAFDVTNAGAAPIKPEAYFQLMRDTKHVGVQSSMAPASFVGPVVYNEQDKFKKIDFGEIDKEAADPSRKPAYTHATRQRLDRHDRALLRRRLAAAGRREAAAAVLHDEARQRPLHGGRALRRGDDSAGRQPASCTSRLYVGPQDQDALAQARAGPRPRRRLRDLHDHRRAAVLAAQVAARPDRQLGLGDHRA